MGSRGPDLRDGGRISSLLRRPTNPDLRENSLRKGMSVIICGYYPKFDVDSQVYIAQELGNCHVLLQFQEYLHFFHPLPFCRRRQSKKMVRNDVFEGWGR